MRETNHCPSSELADNLKNQLHIYIYIYNILYLMQSHSLEVDVFNFWLAFDKKLMWLKSVLGDSLLHNNILR